MTRNLLSLWIALAFLVSASGLLASGDKEEQQPAPARGDLVLVVGAPGTSEYAKLFSDWAAQWKAGAQAGQLDVHEVGTAEAGGASLADYRTACQELETDSPRPLWIVFIGHGTFDGRTARFNLNGPDLEPAELAELLAPCKRPLALIDCTAASAPFLQAVTGPDRVVITATSSGNEVNFAHFGKALAEAVSSREADLDKDEQTSLLEAFLQASRQTEDAYVAEGRLATEHALLDDNGDGNAVSRHDFEGTRPKTQQTGPGGLPDGLAAHQWHLIPSAADAALTPEQILQRNAIERNIAKLRALKATLPEDEYYRRLEVELLKLARLLVPNEE